ncbi:MAG: type II toxin-antitoxin system HicA family toxin [Eubacteriaceae bacterium]|nr:type II toxin-antitoxin system HicA family toxin [Eubacteriaceae bacterium]
MAKKDKLLKRFLEIPNDFTYGELKKLLLQLGYEEIACRGSRVAFEQMGHSAIKIHRPHPTNTVKRVYLRQIRDRMEKEGIIDEK